MAQVGLAQFLSLGQLSVGTQALAKEQTEIFQMAEEGRATWIEEMLNRQLVRRWCGLNYPAQGRGRGLGSGIRPPVLRLRKIAARDLGAWTSALNALVQGQSLQPGKDDEEYVRDAMELPAGSGQVNRGDGEEAR